MNQADQLLINAFNLEVFLRHLQNLHQHTEKKMPSKEKNPIKDEVARGLASVFGCHKLNSFAEMLLAASLKLLKMGKMTFCSYQ